MSEKPVAVITGGSSGIGKAICRKLVQESFQVINADVQTPEAGEEEIEHLACDITDVSAVENLSRLVGEKKQLDVLVLNAGRGIHQKLREGNPEEWAEVINLNLTGNLRVLRALLPFMEKGHVIFISSVSAVNSYPWGGIYAATKAALETIAETLRQEEQPGIKTGVIRAGVVDTPFFKRMISGSQNPESIGWGAVNAEEIATAVIFMIQQKESTAINTLTIRPAAQSL